MFFKLFLKCFNAIFPKYLSSEKVQKAKGEGLDPNSQNEEELFPEIFRQFFLSFPSLIFC